MSRSAARSPGRVNRIAGPVVGCVDLDVVRLYDVVHVGNEGLIGEVIRIDGDTVTVQVYEDTIGLQVGEPVTSWPVERPRHRCRRIAGGRSPRC